MARPARQTSIDEIVQEAMDSIVERASVAIARAISKMAADRIDSELRRGLGSALSLRRGPGRPAGARARVQGAVTRWVADRRARRVPNFVISQTGLKTKKAIVSKFGEGALFEEGKSPKKMA
jgi:hypothetical protein